MRLATMPVEELIARLWMVRGCLVGVQRCCATGRRSQTPNTLG
jgi:hypothetical protein